MAYTLVMDRAAMNQAHMERSDLPNAFQPSDIWRKMTEMQMKYRFWSTGKQLSREKNRDLELSRFHWTRSPKREGQIYTADTRARGATAAWHIDYCML